ncbi:hypothetical protein PIB30_035835 [Stylosanthes scabra]|uniref:Uncharacterized protein n=1 Tax=Stylosanthes scabra TaxID=79078 RepID=A0ABU6ZA34_9FABA|nr:hypothetical protein [Stylosanthes scabra]
MVVVGRGRGREGEGEDVTVEDERWWLEPWSSPILEEDSSSNLILLRLVFDMQYLYSGEDRALDDDQAKEIFGLSGFFQAKRSTQPVWAAPKPEPGYKKEGGKQFSPLPFTLHAAKKERERELVRVAQELQFLHPRQLPDAITFDPELRLTHGLRQREALDVLFTSILHAKSGYFVLHLISSF